MSANGPAGFFVLLQPSGVLLLRGELDLATVQDLQDAIDEILVPGEPIILDLAQLTFLETSAIHCLIRNGARAVIQSSYGMFPPVSGGSWTGPMASLTPGPLISTDHGRSRRASPLSSTTSSSAEAFLHPSARPPSSARLYLASGIALVGTSCADERSTFKGIGPSPLPGFGYQGPIRSQNPLRLRSEARPATLDSIRERAPQATEGLSALPSRILVPRHVCRRSLTLGNDGETVVLVDDPLDVPDEVLRHDSELPRIHPDVPVLIHGDRDYATAGLERALARDLDAPTGRVNLVCPFDLLVRLS